MLIVDDMILTPQWDIEQQARQQHARQVLLTSPLLTSVELGYGSVRRSGFESLLKLDTS